MNQKQEPNQIQVQGLEDLLAEIESQLVDGLKRTFGSWSNSHRRLPAGQDIDLAVIISPMTLEELEKTPLDKRNTGYIPTFLPHLPPPDLRFEAIREIVLHKKSIAYILVYMGTLTGPNPSIPRVPAVLTVQCTHQKYLKWKAYPLSVVGSSYRMLEAKEHPLDSTSVQSFHLVFFDPTLN